MTKLKYHKYQQDNPAKGFRVTQVEDNPAKGFRVTQVDSVLYIP